MYKLLFIEDVKLNAVKRVHSLHFPQTVCRILIQQIYQTCRDLLLTVTVCLKFSKSEAKFSSICFSGAFSQIQTTEDCDCTDGLSSDTQSIAHVFLVILTLVSALIPAGNMCLYQKHQIHHSFFSPVHLLRCRPKNFCYWSNSLWWKNYPDSTRQTGLAEAKQSMAALSFTLAS